MRLKFTIANLLLLTVIAALAAQMYRNHIRFQKLDAELARHKALRAQAHRVRQRELELNAAMEKSKSELQVSQSYQWAGFADQLTENVKGPADSWPGGLEFSSPLGTRRAAAMVRHAELRLARERELLQQLERDLSQIED
jgi:hypothetical protein